MVYRTLGKIVLLATVVVGCSFLAACGEKKEMGPKELQAIQMVKAYTPEGSVFSVISNIEKMAEDSGRKGDKWELGPWEAGLPTQKDRIIETLSQYFTMFRPAGDYWVRFSYKNNEGSFQGLWDVNIYSKKIVPKNDVAQKLSTPPAQ